MFKTKFTVKYSRNDMDSWNDGTQVVFTIESDRHIDESKKFEIVKGYLEATNISYREFMCKLEIVK